MKRPTPVTDIHESQLSRWLFTDFVRESLWKELNLPFPARIAFEPKTPEVPGNVPGPGDIDVLVCNPNRPENAVAFQCKLVKVRPETFATLLPGKLRRLKKGAQQANGQWELEFHQSYLLVCVEIDGRQRHEYNFFGRGLSGPLVKKTYDSLKTLQLLPEVGLVVAEIMQPVEKHIEDAGGVGIKVVRRATQQIQSTAVTDWVRLQVNN